MRQRRLVTALACLLVPLAGALWWRAARFLPSSREREAVRLTLPELEKGFVAHQNDPIYLYHLGSRLQAAGRSEEALGVLERAAGLSPDEIRIRRAWTDVLMATGRVTGAQGYLQEFVRSHPKSSEGHTLLGEFYGSQNSMERAQEELETAIRLDSQNSHAWTLLAKVRDYFFNVGGAREAVLAALKADPQNADAHAYLGRLETKSNPDAAIRSLREAVRLAPEQSEFARALAALLLDTTKPEAITEAEGLLRRQQSARSDDPEAMRLLGRALLLRKQVAEALALLTKADTLAPGEPLGAKYLLEANRLAGDTAQISRWQKIYEGRQKDAEATRQLRDQLVKDPKNKETHRQMAHLMAKRGQPEQTLRHYASAIGAALDSPKALILAANDLTEFGFGKEALALARLAVRHGQNNPGALEARGNALLSLGRIREASVDYAQISDLQREKMPLYRQKLLAAIQKQQQNPTPGERVLFDVQRRQQAEIGPRRTTNELLGLIEKALEKEPESIALLSKRFEMLVARRERDKALACGAQLLALSPEDTQTHARMAALLTDTDDAKFDPAQVEKHLDEADRDPLVQPTLRYVRGLLALRRQDWPVAVTELRQAVAMDPGSDIAYLRLAKAERAAGNEKEAAAATQIYDQRRRSKQEEVDLLMEIADHPDQKTGYQKAIEYYRQKDRANEADAVRQEAIRRFGSL
jgi:tetratricopeptide (TPR) repeat protein